MIESILEALAWVLRVNLYVFMIAGLLMSVRVMQFRWRLRSVKVQWYARPHGIFPLFALYFIGVLTLLIALNFKDQAYPALLMPSDIAAYLVMAVSVVYLTRSLSLVYVNANGIVKNITSPSQSIPWFAIHDYVRYDVKEAIRYVFLYRASGEQEPRRLSLEVPIRKDALFQKQLQKHLKI